MSSPHEDPEVRVRHNPHCGKSNLHIDASADNQYVSPEKAVKERGADIVIVGRGITEAGDVAEAAEKYRTAAWNAYQERCGDEK